MYYDSPMIKGYAFTSYMLERLNNMKRCVMPESGLRFVAYDDLAAMTTRSYKFLQKYQHVSVVEIPHTYFGTDICSKFTII